MPHLKGNFDLKMYIVNINVNFVLWPMVSRICFERNEGVESSDVRVKFAVDRNGDYSALLSTVNHCSK